MTVQDARPGTETDRGEGADAPLDPAAERLRRKLMRLLLGSFGIMALGLIAVFSAIVYKLGGEKAGPAATVEARVDLPAGARLSSASLDGDRLLLSLALPDGGVRLLVLDAASGRVATRVDVAPAGGGAAN